MVRMIEFSSDAVSGNTLEALLLVLFLLCFAVAARSWATPVDSRVYIANDGYTTHESECECHASSCGTLSRSPSSFVSSYTHTRPRCKFDRDFALDFESGGLCSHSPLSYAPLLPASFLLSFSASLGVCAPTLPAWALLISPRHLPCLLTVTLAGPSAAARTCCWKEWLRSATSSTSCSTASSSSRASFPRVRWSSSTCIQTLTNKPSQPLPLSPDPPPTSYPPPPP